MMFRPLESNLSMSKTPVCTVIGQRSFVFWLVDLCSIHTFLSSNWVNHFGYLWFFCRQQNQWLLNNALCYFFNPLEWKKSPFFRICKTINNNRSKTCESILQKQIVRFSFAYHKRAYYFCYLYLYSLMFYHILAQHARFLWK